MFVVVGFVEEGYGAQFFNAAAVLRDGKLVFVHRKLNLANYGDMQEAKFFATGRYIEPFALAGRFVGAVLLCSDMWNPPLVHIAALHGATMLVVPTNSSLDSNSGDVSKPERWDTVLHFYASIYGLPIVFANRVGREGVHTFWGGSRIVDAFGNVVAQADGDAEQLISCAVSYDDVREARYKLPTVRDSNLGLIHREIQRLEQRIGVPALVRQT
jgi:predicted amidohydrolase